MPKTYELSVMTSNDIASPVKIPAVLTRRRCPNPEDFFEVARR
jgi:hypothetical protein